MFYTSFNKSTLEKFEHNGQILFKASLMLNKKIKIAFKVNSLNLEKLDISWDKESCALKEGKKKYYKYTLNLNTESCLIQSIKFPKNSFISQLPGEWLGKKAVFYLEE